MTREQATMTDENSSTSATLRALLVAAVQQQEPPPGVELCPTGEVVRAAVRHRVTPAVYLCLKDTSVDPELVAFLQARHDDQLARHLTSAADLGIVSEVFDRLGLQWVVMKGPVLAELLWPRPDMRMYLDLDVVVQREGFEAAVEGLTAAGARLLDRNWPLIAEHHRAELTLQLPYGTYLDLHWHLLNYEGLRRDIPLAMDAMLARARTARIGELDLPTFDITDTLLTVVLHATLAGATRLMWLKDVERAAAQPGLDWREVKARSGEQGLDIALTMMLRKAWRTLGVRPPHPGWRPPLRLWPLVAQAVDRFVETPGLYDDHHSGQVLFESVRTTSWASAKVAWHELRHPPAGYGTATNPLHEPVDDAAARRSYFDEVSGKTSAR